MFNYKGSNDPSLKNKMLIIYYSKKLGYQVIISETEKYQALIFLKQLYENQAFDENVYLVGIFQIIRDGMIHHFIDLGEILNLGSNCYWNKHVFR